MNERCDTCKFWEPPENRRETLGYCNHERVQNDWEDFSDGLRANGIYEDSAQVHTGPAFGCVHWRPK